MQGLEWVVILIIVALLVLFGPSHLPKLARAIGRSWGEFRRGRLEVEREIGREFAGPPSQ
ncbi:MAG TPA: twin-arginine translocase TatA/TatE family subunit [Thermoplasmata archaeon]|nr:twin-arginine translocase TatA/TatE family subunit [Thermoplasmata archaeon]